MSECDKLNAVHDRRLALLAFLEWLGAQGIDLHYTETDAPVMERYDQLVLRFFEIDASKLEEERRKMLEELRAKTP